MREYYSNNTFGSLSSAPDGKIIEKIFSFVTSVLLDFQGNANDNENYLTNELCKSLDFRKPGELPFSFHHQNIEDGKENTSTDFAVFGTYAYAQSIQQQGREFPLVKFEAKRLSSTLPKKREREYVLGDYEKDRQLKNSGGIERFKNLRHGQDVNHASIIGYVQTDSFAHWEEKINGWIREEIAKPHDSTLIWDNNDCLSASWSGTRVCSFQSNPKRKGIPELNMRHLWINLFDGR